MPQIGPQGLPLLGKPYFSATLPGMSSAEQAIVVNGEATPVQAGSTLSDLLAQLDLAGRKVAVAINRDVVPRSCYAERTLDPGDRVEILEAVGGG